MSHQIQKTELNQWSIRTKLCTFFFFVQIKGKEKHLKGANPLFFAWSHNVQSGTPPNNEIIKKQTLHVLPGPDLQRAPSQYSIKCNDKNENRSELEAEHQWKAGGVRKRRSAPSSDNRRQRACTSRVV